MPYAAINQWSYGASMSALQCLKMAAEQGYGGFEPAFSTEGELSPKDYQKTAKELKAAAGDAGIRLDTLASGAYWQYPPSSDDPAIRDGALEIMLRQIDCARELGAKTILIVPGTVGEGFFGKGASYTNAYKRAQDCLSAAAEYAEKSEIFIGVENVWNNFLLSPMEFAGFVDSINSPYIRAYFDVGNVVPYGDSADWIDTLGQRIAAIHVKDYRKAVGTIHGFVPLLEGDVDWPRVMAALRGIGYEGPLTAEISPLRLHPTLAGKQTKQALDLILSL